METNLKVKVTWSGKVKSEKKLCAERHIGIWRWEWFGNRSIFFGQFCVNEL